MTAPKTPEDAAKVYADRTGGSEYSQVWKNAHDSYLAGERAGFERGVAAAAEIAERWEAWPAVEVAGQIRALLSPGGGE